MPVIRCPACNARYQVSAAAGGKRAKCKHCGQAFRIPTLEQAEQPPDEELRLADLDALAGGEALERPAEPVEAGPAAAALPPSEVVAYAPDQAAQEAAAARGAYSAYFRSLGRSLAFFTNAGSLATFLILCFILVIGNVAAMGLSIICFPLGLIVTVIVYGWYMSFQVNVVLGKAGGEDELPSITLTGGWYEDIVAPFLKMLAATALSRLAAAVFLATVLVQRGGGGLMLVIATVAFVLRGDYGLLLDQPDVQTQLTGGLLLLAGFFFWPMFVLVVAVAGPAGLVRLDLMGITIGKSLPAYLIAALVVYAAEAVALGTGLLAAALGIGGLFAGADVSLLLVLALAFLLVGAYTKIVAMRAIGLYYHHFKHKFAWSWG